MSYLEKFIEAARYRNELFPKAIESLIEDDLLEERTLALTKKGYDLVYGS
jgi:hypothetical protein